MSQMMNATLPAPLHLLTGPASIGKSSVCLRLARYLREQGRTAGGIVTLTAGIYRYALDLLSAEQRLLAAEGEFLSGPTWGAFAFSQAAFDWANAVVVGAVASSVDLVILDEVGPLELHGGAGFLPALQVILESTTAGLLVVRPALLDQVRAIAEPRPITLWTVTPQIRDTLPTQVAADLFPRSPS